MWQDFVKRKLQTLSAIFRTRDSKDRGLKTANTVGNFGGGNELVKTDMQCKNLGFLSLLFYMSPSGNVVFPE